MHRRLIDPTTVVPKHLRAFTTLLLFFLIASVFRGAAKAQEGWDTMKPLSPRSYDCLRADRAPVVDGVLSDLAWDRALWSDLFVDIRGPGHTPPRYDTRVKMLWDGDFLYIGAEMDEPHVWGTLTEKNSVIYHDNDFEVFIDPDGDRQNYYEFEVNVLNTIWELTLVKTYRDGGPAHHGTNIDGLRSAVNVNGTVNNPNDEDTAWTVEIAIPWQGLAPYSRSPVPPRQGDVWRINFSRVQWQHEITGGLYSKVPEVPEDNWVWSPQGVIDMHRPERWGYVRFLMESPESAWEDPTLPARDFLMEAYYLQRRHIEDAGRWASDVSELGLSANALESSGFRPAELSVAGDGYRLTLVPAEPGSDLPTLSVDDSGQLLSSYSRLDTTTTR